MGGALNPSLGYNNIKYSKVTEYTGISPEKRTKQVLTYTYETPNIVGGTRLGPGRAGFYIPSAYVMTYRDWGNGLLTKKELFRNISTGTSPDTYQKVSDERMNYTAFYTKTLSGFYAFQIANYPDNSGSSIGDAFGAREFIDRDVFSGQCYNKVDFLMPASINPQNISTGGYYLKSDTVSQYESASTITTVTEYEHANQFHNYPTKITKTLSTGEKK